ncbi:winged helix-turn-helix domain-containing protein [Sulfurisphaera javensis]|uniref:Winged helix-turn-helix domain-containing protein n=1 Tax=Sulfurisphaera javensis TaxID=2049879 RepID=A0AAT9GV27_9CREN
MRVEFNKRKRTKYDIMFDILYALSDGPLSKTRLIYKANLTYVIAEKYIPYLEKKNAIKKEGREYVITPIGRELLEKLKIYREKADEIRQLLVKIKQKLNTSNTTRNKSKQIA